MKKKQTLLVSGLCLCLSAVMLTGTTLAWFTDSVANENNVIQAGELEIRGTGYYWNGQEWTTDHHFYDARIQETNWEPGQYNAKVIRISNWHSDVAAKVKLDFELVSNDKNLADALWYRITPVVTNNGNYLNGKDAEDILKHLNDRPTSQAEYADVTCVNQIELDDGKERVLSGNQDYVYYIIEYGMYTDAGNEYQGGSIQLDYTVQATQATYEQDGFGGDQYDAGATYDMQDAQG